MTSILVEVEFHLRLLDDARNVGPVLIAVAKDRNRPRRAALASIHPSHAAEVHVGDLPAQARERLDALDQDLLQLVGGACRSSHATSITQ